MTGDGLDSNTTLHRVLEIRAQQPLHLVAVRTCPFCLTYKKQYRIHNIDNILDEIEDCVSIGITEVHFVDDLFSPNSQWVTQVL